MDIVCNKDQCVGCMACVDVCPKGAISIQDDLTAYNAVIDEDKCIHCNLCHTLCQVNAPVAKSEPIVWLQGWTKDEEVRKKSSSGGLAAALSKAFIAQGGVVCSCAFDKGEFGFSVARTVEELSRFAGSKYVKSNPIKAHSEVKRLLKEGEKVLFIGLPCQVAGIKKSVGVKLQENLFNADLICHGTPSPKVLETFLNQYKLSLAEANTVQFRRKTRYQVYVDDKSVGVKGSKDRYSMAFLSGLICTENCYQCQYASTSRVSDITLGDSWGSTLVKEEQDKGISLILCQSERGRKLLEDAHLHLEEVDVENAIAHNGQLSYSIGKPKYRVKFLSGLKAGKKFNGLMFRANPKWCLKQNLKSILLTLGILKAK